MGVVYNLSLSDTSGDMVTRICHHSCHHVTIKKLLLKPLFSSGDTSDSGDMSGDTYQLFKIDTNVTTGL